jgi:CRP-like cAMP-binding protein
MTTPYSSKDHCPNRILQALRSPVRQRLLSRLKTLSFQAKDQLYDRDEIIKGVYFPLSGVFSLASVIHDGGIAEVAMVGNEGMLGLPIFFRAESIPLRVVCQVSGDALFMDAFDFKEEIHDEDSELNEILYRYTHTLFNQIAQHSACNSLHSIEERCARWLLMTHDRVHADEFPLRHEFLAQMLGVRGSNVTLVTGILQQAGLITYKNGILHVLDRAGLEAASCDHYQLIKKEYDHFLGHL